METENPRVDVTDEDIHTARRLWLAALDGDTPVAYVARLHDDLRRLIHAQAQQLADDLRESRAAG